LKSGQSHQRGPWPRRREPPEPIPNAQSLLGHPPEPPRSWSLAARPPELQAEL